MKQQIWWQCALLAVLALPAAAQPVPPAPPPAGRTRMLHMLQGSGGYLGVGVEEIDHERAQALGLREEHGVEVKSVEEGSPASKAGLRVGDVVLDYNGQRVEGVEQFTRMVGETPAGRRCNLGIWRNRNAQSLSATLATREWQDHFGTGMGDWERGKKDFGEALRHMPPMPPMPEMPPMLPKPNMGWQMGVLGIEGEELTPQLAEFFGVKQGILVRAVVRDSAAERAGLKAGDVITRVDGTVVTTPREISSLMRAARAKPSTQLTVFRSHREMSLEVRKSERSEREIPRPPEPPR